MLSLAAQCIVIGPVCLWVCYHHNSKLHASILTKLRLKLVVTISSWLNFAYPASPGRGSAEGRKFLAPPYYSQCAVFASPLSTFSFWFCFDQPIIPEVTPGQTNLPVRLLPTVTFLQARFPPDTQSTTCENIQCSSKHWTNSELN